jgi:hypothetical protein
MPWKNSIAMPFGLFVGIAGDVWRTVCLFGQLARICGLASSCWCRRRCQSHQASQVLRDGGHEELVTGSAQTA